MHSEVSQYFSVQIDAIGGEKMHQPRVRNPVLAGTCINTGNPEATESTLLTAAVAVGITHRFVNRILGYGIDFAAGTEVTLGSF